MVSVVAILLTTAVIGTPANYVYTVMDEREWLRPLLPSGRPQPHRFLVYWLTGTAAFISVAVMDSLAWELTVVLVVGILFCTSVISGALDDGFRKYLTLTMKDERRLNTLLLASGFVASIFSRCLLYVLGG